MRTRRLVGLATVLVIAVFLSGCLSRFGLVPPPEPGEKPLLVYKFDIGNGPVAPGYTQVTCGDVYTAAKGYGFDPNAKPNDSRDRGGSDPLRRDFCLNPSELIFLVDVPAGWYNVTFIIGDPSASQSTVTAYLEGNQVHSGGAGSGQFIERSVNVQVIDGQLTFRATASTIRLNALQVVQLPGEPPAES